MVNIISNGNEFRCEICGALVKEDDIQCWKCKSIFSGQGNASLIKSSEIKTDERKKVEKPKINVKKLLLEAFFVIAFIAITFIALRYAIIQNSFTQLENDDPEVRAQAAQTMWRWGWQPGWQPKRPRDRRALLIINLDEGHIENASIAELASMGPDGIQLIARRLKEDPPCDSSMYRAVIQLGDTEFIPLIIARLKSKFSIGLPKNTYSYEETWFAIAALRIMAQSKQEALDILLNTIEKEIQDETLNETIIAVLGSLQDPRSTDTLRNCLYYQIKNPELSPTINADYAAIFHAQAALALGQLGTPDARNILQTAISNENYVGVIVAINVALSWDTPEKRPVIVILDLVRNNNATALTFFTWSQNGADKWSCYAGSKGWSYTVQPALSQPSPGEWLK